MNSTRKRSMSQPRSLTRSKRRKLSMPNRNRQNFSLLMGTRSQDWSNRIRPKKEKAPIQSEPMQPTQSVKKSIRNSIKNSMRNPTKNSMRKSRPIKIKLKKIRIVSAHAVSKQRLTYNSMLVLLKKMANMLIAGSKLKDIMESLSKKIGGNYRALLSRGNPDKECGAAASMANNEGEQMCPAFKYRTSNFRQNQSKEKDQRDYSKNMQYNAELPFAWIKEDIIEDNKWKKKMMKKPFKPTGKGACGDCWLCGLPVQFYYNNELVTGCGECEHIGAISASFLTGMLSSAGLYAQVYNYGSAHVHCNQRKGQKLSVKFDNRNLKWVIDENGTRDIINSIRTPIIHNSEYDLEFIKNRGKMNQSDMKSRIISVSNNWCKATNAILSAHKEKVELADRLCNIMILTIEPIKNKIITDMDIEDAEEDEDADQDRMEVEGGRVPEVNRELNPEHVLNINKQSYNKVDVNNKEIWLENNVKNEKETDGEWLNRMFNEDPELMQTLLGNLIQSIDATLEKLYDEADIKEINDVMNET